MPNPAPAPQEPQQGQNVPQAQEQRRQETGDLASNVKLLQDITVGIVVVLFIGFVGAFIAVGGMIVNYESERQATYEDLKDQVVLQGIQIQTQNTTINAIAKKLNVQQ